MERMNSKRILQEGVFNFGTRNSGMRLNKLMTKLGISEIKDIDGSTWESKTNGPQRAGGEGEAEVTIGGKPLPTDVAERWDWSTEENEQLILKIAHEIAHKFQHDRGYEAALVRSLSNEAIADTDKDFTPYIMLYLTLENSGSITGLGADPFYKAQSESTGKLKVEVLEDMNELIAAYLIGNGYLLYKVQTSVSAINQAQAEQIVVLVSEVCKEFD